MHEYRVWLKPNQISPFLANILFKTPENQRFFGFFRGYEMGALTRNGLSSKWHNKSNYTIKIEAATGGALCKKVFVKNSQNSQENTCAKVSFLIKLKASACNFIKKETLAKVFSCEFWEIF